MLSFNIHIQLYILIRWLIVMREASVQSWIFVEDILSHFAINAEWPSERSLHSMFFGVTGCALLCQVLRVCIDSPTCVLNRCLSPQTECCVVPVCACQNILCCFALPTLEGPPGRPHLLPQHLVSARKGTQLHNQPLILLKIAQASSGVRSRRVDNWQVDSVHISINASYCNVGLLYLAASCLRLFFSWRSLQRFLHKASKRWWSCITGEDLM